MPFQKLVLVTHRWAGIASFLFLIVVALSGSALVYWKPLNRLTTPAFRRIEPRGEKLPLERIIEAARTRRGDPLFSVRRGDADEPDQVILRNFDVVVVNPYTAAVIGEVSEGSTIGGVLSTLHGDLFAGRIGHILVGVAGVIALFEAVTGFIRWLRYRTVSITRGGNFRRVVFELHNASGVLALVFVVILSATGVVISFGGQIGPLLQRLDRRQSFPPLVAVDSGAGISPDSAAAIALARYRGSLAAVMIPRQQRDPYVVSVRPPGDNSEGRIRVTVTRAGEVRNVRHGGEGQPGSRLLYWNTGLHGGWIFGWVGELIACVAGIALAVQAATGFLVWWKPR